MNSINIYLINIIQVVFFTSTPLNSCAKHELINEPYNWLVETIWKMQVGNAKIAFAELINMELAKLVLHSLWDWRGIVPRSPVFSPVHKHFNSPQPNGGLFGREQSAIFYSGANKPIYSSDVHLRVRGRLE